MAPLLVMKVNCACTTAGSVTAQIRQIRIRVRLVSIVLPLYRRIQTSFVLFVQPKPPLAGSMQTATLAHGDPLGLCWGARPSRLPFSASRRKPVSQTNLSNDVPGATPETARETHALPPFVQSKLPLAGSLPTATLAHGHPLGHCWGARPSRLPFSASRQKPFPKRNGSTHGSGAWPAFAAGHLRSPL